MAEAPSVEDLGPLLGETGALDQPADDLASDTGPYEAAAMAAVGTRQKAAALKDAITEVLRENGLLGGAEESLEEPDEDAEEDELPY